RRHTRFSRDWSSDVCSSDLEGNAHPHATEKVAIVHNGIIENFRDLLADLARDGYLPKTQTDTESVALWVTRELDRGLDPEMAVRSEERRVGTEGRARGAAGK